MSHQEIPDEVIAKNPVYRYILEKVIQDAIEEINNSNVSKDCAVKGEVKQWLYNLIA